MKHKDDVLDYVYIQISNRIKSKEVLVEVQEAIIDTRQSFAGVSYVRNDKPEVRQAYTYWMQLKSTNMTMKEIYEYISDQVQDLTPRTAETYIRQFIKGFNPYEITEA